MVLVILTRYARERCERIRRCMGVFAEAPKCGKDHEHTLDCGGLDDVCLYCRKTNYEHSRYHGARFCADFRRYIFTLLCAVLLGIILRTWKSVSARQRRWTGTAIAVFLIASVLWILDVTRLVCWPDSLLQLHAAWHILGALTIWLLYRAESE